MTQGDLVQGLEQGDAMKSSMPRPVVAQVLNLLAIVANIFCGQLNAWLSGDDDLPRPGVPESVSYLQPAIYAFIVIWPTIYLGEVVFGIWQAIQRPDSAPEERMKTIQAVAPPYFAAHAVTCVWVFLPDISQRLVAIGIVAVLLGVAHGVVAPMKQGVDYYLMAAPITLHFGWGTAATLVTLNTVVARSTSSVATKLALLAGSLAFAACAGVFFAARRKSGLIAGTVGWAIFAVAVATLFPITLDSQLETKYNEDLGVAGRYAIGAAEAALGAALFGYAYVVQKNASTES